MDESEKILQDQFAKLPKELRSFIGESKWLADCGLIEQQYNLTKEEAESLQRVVLFVLTGLITSEDIRELLISDLGIQNTIALEIQDAVTEKILSQLSPEALSALQNNEDRPLSPATNLIEDSKGNADNILPPLPGEKEVAQAPEAPLPTELKQAVPNLPKIPPQKPESALTDAEWEARKKALEAGELVMKTAYGSKPDPYREPTA